MLQSCPLLEHGVNGNANSLHPGVLNTKVARNDVFFGYTNSEKQNDDVKKRMEDERAATRAQREADLLAWHKTLNDRLESFSHNYPP
ncbi:hypothetical protein Tco_1378174 [Tanacetum coccineum]